MPQGRRMLRPSAISCTIRDAGVYTSAMDRSPDDLLTERSLDDELLDEEPALLDGFHEDPIMDRHNAVMRREQLDAELNHLTDEEMNRRGFSINEISHPRVLRWLNDMSRQIAEGNPEAFKGYGEPRGNQPPDEPEPDDPDGH